MGKSRRKRRPGGGRHPADPSGRREHLSIRVSPAERDHLKKLGRGSAGDGVRVLLRRSMES